MKVFVYYNLHKKLWSIKALEGENKGKVVHHSEHVLLSDVTPKVSQAGRDRVLREQCKNVHAGLVGYLEAFEMTGTKLGMGISYNPYFEDHFYYVDDRTEFTGSVLVYLSGKRVNEV